MKEVSDIEDYSKEKEGVVDESFPVQFCPICGSDDLCSSGTNEKLLNAIYRVSVHCNCCNWEYEVFVTKKGKNQVKIRLDMKDCKICKKDRKRWEKLAKKKK